MGIGIVGVGGVARYAHLPAYRKLGLPVQAICDVDRATLSRVQAETHVQFATVDVDELASDPSVTVIDIATPPDSHRALLTSLHRYGKPLLLQKPLCGSRTDFEAILTLWKRGLRVRLNLTGRYVSAWRKVRQLLREQQIGEPRMCTILNRDWWDREAGRWEHTLENLIIHEMVIHHLDLCLFWFGSPWRVAARGGRHPGQVLQQCNWATVQLEFETSLVVSLVEDWTMSEFAFASGHPLEEVVINGTEGVIRATSQRVECARMGENAIQVWHLPRPGQRLPGEILEVGWFPDSFGHSMRDFLHTLENPDAARHDWEHLAELTALTFTVAEALTSDRWLEYRPVMHSPC